MILHILLGGEWLLLKLNNWLLQKSDNYQRGNQGWMTQNSSGNYFTFIIERVTYKIV